MSSKHDNRSNSNSNNNGFSPVELEEEDYISGVAHIVERDFFPSLKRLKLQSAYLDALERGDSVTAQRLRTLLLMANDLNPSASASASTALLHPSPASLDSQAPEGLRLNLPLDTFQAIYTSQDNASFDRIVEEENKHRKQKFDWIFNNKDRLLLLPSGPATDPEGNQGPRAELDYDNDRLANPKQLEYKGKVATWEYNPKNHLMNFPEGLPQTRMISSSSSSSSTQAASLKGDPKSISHAATRFNTDSNIVMAPPPPLHHQNNNSSFNSEFYKDMYSATPSLSHLKAQRGLVHLDPDNSSSTNRTGASTPNPYDFVPATPTLAPGVDVDPAELMTWGSIEGTPLLISGGGGETGGPRFSIAPTPKRDVIGHELSEKAAKSIRKRSEIAAGGGGGGGVSGGGRLGGRITTPRDLSLRSPYNPYHSTPRGTSSSSSSLNASTLMRSRMLSPAAQSLLQKTSSIKVSSSSSSSSSSHPFGSFSSSSSFSKSGAFTPRDSISTPPLVITTPRTKPSSSLSSSSISIPTNIKNNNTSSSSITDDLLKF